MTRTTTQISWCVEAKPYLVLSCSPATFISMQRGTKIAFALVFTMIISSSLSAQDTGEENEENKEYSKLFEQYDWDRDGYITMEENLEQDRIIAEEQKKPFDEEHSRLSFQRADLDKDGRVSLEEMSTPKPPDEHCKELYGDFAEFDGVQSCRCMRTYTADVNGTCVKGDDEVCAKQFGSFAEFDGVNTCVCKNGTIPNANGTCIEGSNATCREQFGEYALFDTVNSTCVCERGAVPDFNGTCMLGSNELCQDWYGPNTAFDGINSCVCKKGFVYADGECFRGSNQVCASILAGSKFDGINDCKCRKGYEKDEARSMCVKTNQTKGRASVELKPVPLEGTLTITIVEAKHLPKMDTHTKCDPFVVVTLGNQTRKTRVIKKTYDPQWQETFRLSFNESSPPPSEVTIEIFDWDLVGGAREFVGKVVLQLGELVGDEEVQGWFDLEGRDGGVVRGHDRNSSALHLSAVVRPGMPYVPWWESRPDWILTAVRSAVAAWMLLGAGIWIRERRSAPKAHAE